ERRAELRDALRVGLRREHARRDVLPRRFAPLVAQAQRPVIFTSGPAALRAGEGTVLGLRLDEAVARIDAVVRHDPGVEHPVRRHALLEAAARAPEQLAIVGE